MKAIKIQTCEECPNVGHKGAFGNPAYIPVCGKEHRELPYTESSFEGKSTAHGSGLIPEWCPLEDCTITMLDENGNRSIFDDVDE